MKFDKIEKIYLKSKNSLFICYKGNKKFFVKNYTIREGRKRDDLLKMRCEILCYKKLKFLGLPKLVKSDYKKRLLVLEFVKFKNLRSFSKSSIDQVIDLYSNVILKIKAPFLPRVTYSYYQNSLLKRAKTLKEKGIIPDYKKIFKLFEENRKLIDRSAIHFSHGDLHIGNIKIFNNKLTFIDLEHSRRDNLMYDLASIYESLLNHKPTLAKYFITKISKLKHFNKKLFDLMILRRGVEVLYATRYDPSSIKFRNAKKLIINF